MATTSMEEFLNLYDHTWFNQNVIFPKYPDQENPPKFTPNSENPPNFTPNSENPPKFTPNSENPPKFTPNSENPPKFIPNSENPPKFTSNSSQILVRSFSDQILSNAGNSFSSNGNVSPDSVLTTTPEKLQTIVSGREFKGFGEKIEEQEQGRKNREFVVKNTKKKKNSKSFSELEFEELKGFMDLGFVFSEEDKDSKLASIIPGLQRFGEKQGNMNEFEDDDDDKCRVSRPYLSEAWEMLDQRKEEVNPLMNWKIPSNLISNEVDMKNHLRFWAHTVASTVR